MAGDLGLTRTQVTLASTVATLAGAAAAVPVGRLLDRHGGRATMTLGALLAALGVLGWSRAESLLELTLAFAAMGVAQCMSMYDAAFAVLVASSAPGRAQQSILTMTMVVGITTYLASPLVGLAEVHLGWRDTVAALGLIHLLISVPLHLRAVPGRALHRSQAPRRTGAAVSSAVRDRDFWLLVVAFTGHTAAITAVTTLLVSHLRDVGHSPLVATTIPVAIGVLQVLSRLLLSAFPGRISVARACVVAFTTQGVGMVLLPLVDTSIPLAVLCVACVGLGNGVGVIARPVVLNQTFGALQFASIMAVLTIPLALSRAASPVLASLLTDGLFLLAFGAASLVAAAALVPVARRPAGR